MNRHQDYEHLTWIGTIIGAHGLNGVLRVRPLTYTPEYYLNVDGFMLETKDALKSVEVEEISLASSQWRIRFSGIQNRNEAEALNGLRLLLADTELKPLEKDEVFLHRLVGLRVEDREGVNLGEVTGTLETGANLVYEVRLEGREYLLPASPGIVLDVDVEKGKLIIDPVPGLLDDASGDQSNVAF